MNKRSDSIDGSIWTLSRSRYQTRPGRFDFQMITFDATTMHREEDHIAWTRQRVLFSQIFFTLMTISTVQFIRLQLHVGLWKYFRNTYSIPFDLISKLHFIREWRWIVYVQKCSFTRVHSRTQQFWQDLSCDMHGRATLMSVSLRVRLGTFSIRIAISLANVLPGMAACRTLSSYSFDISAILKGYRSGGSHPSSVHAISYVALASKVATRALNNFLLPK
jgi:hypothetical protein